MAHLGRQGELDTLCRWVERVQRHVPDKKHLPEKTACLLEAARHLVHSEKVAMVDQTLGMLDNLLEKGWVPPPALLCTYFDVLSQRERDRGHFGHALRYNEQALFHAELARNRLLAGEMMLHCAWGYANVGELELSAHTLSQSEHIAVELKVPRLGLDSKVQNLLLLALKGKYKEAESAAVEVLSICDPLQDAEMAGTAKIHVARAYLTAGRFSEAIEWAEDALALLNGLPIRRRTANTIVDLALIWRDGSLPSAKNQVASRKTTVRGVEVGEGLDALLRIETALLSEGPERATEIARDAVAVLESQLATLENAHWEDTFISQIPELKRIMQHADSLGVSRRRKTTGDVEPRDNPSPKLSNVARE
jgi:tetratricopeptide (TPR) repeat protein